jgi:hypothetical protein
MQEENNLSSYVAAARSSGADDAAIAANLASAGWPEAAIKNALLPTASGISPHSKKRLILSLGGALSVFFLIMVFLLFKENIFPSPSVLPKNSPPVAAPMETPETPIAAQKNADDFDLLLSALDISADENAYFPPEVLAPLSALSREQVEKYLSGEEWDEAKIADMTKQYEEIIANFALASRKTRFQVPEFANPRGGAGLKAPDYQLLYLAALITALDASARANNGAPDDGAVLAFTIIRYGHKMASSQINTDGFIRGLEIKKIGLSTLRQIIVHPQFSPTLSQQLFNTINNLGDLSSALSDVFKVDYWIAGDRSADAAMSARMLAQTAGAECRDFENKALNARCADIILTSSTLAALAK